MFHANIRVFSVCGWEALTKQKYFTKEVRMTVYGNTRHRVAGGGGVVRRLRVIHIIHSLSRGKTLHMSNILAKINNHVHVSGHAWSTWAQERGSVTEPGEGGWCHAGSALAPLNSHAPHAGVGASLPQGHPSATPAVSAHTGVTRVTQSPGVSIRLELGAPFIFLPLESSPMFGLMDTQLT